MTDVVTGEAVVLDVQAARLPSRILAFGIDLLIQASLFLVLSIPAIAVIGLGPALAAGVTLVVYVGIVVGYPVTCESVWRGRSAGKLALGLRVVSEDGGPERFRQALVRGLVGFVEIWVFSGSVAVIASLLSHQGKRLGDVFAGTLVIRERVPVSGGILPSMPPGLATWAEALELSRLPDEVAQTARQYVARYFELAPEVREEMGRRIATTVSVYVSPVPPPGTDPMLYLSAVLAERRRREEGRLRAQRPGVTPSPPPGPAHRPGTGSSHPSSRPPGNFAPPG